MTKIIREVPNHFNLPYRLKRLADLAHNLWWVWNPEAARLFKDIDALGWDNCNHNPIVFDTVSYLHRLEKFSQGEFSIHPVFQ